MLLGSIPTHPACSRSWAQFYTEVSFPLLQQRNKICFYFNYCQALVFLWHPQRGEGENKYSEMSNNINVPRQLKRDRVNHSSLGFYFYNIYYVYELQNYMIIVQNKERTEKH